MSTTSSFHLLSLPELVVNNIFSRYLDLRSLKVLRLTSSHCKVLIESNPETLKRFRLVVHRMKRLTEILNSKIPWNNLSINFRDVKASAVKMFSAKLEKLSRKFTNRLRIIEIGMNDDGDMESLKYFLGNCASTLEHATLLKLSELDFEYLDNRVDQFPELKFLEVDISAGIGTKFGNFLIKLPCLRRLTIHQSADMRMNSVDKDLTQPLKSYLNHRLNHSILLPLEIKFAENPRIRRLLANAIPPADLIEIARLCFKVNVKLVNLSISSLPTYADVVEDNSDIQKCLDASIHSVISYTERFKDQYIPSTSQISAIVDLKTDSDFDGFELPDEIHSISVNTNVMISLDARESGSKILHKMFHSPRPLLKELAIRRCGYLLLSSDTIQFHRFPNLTKLEIHVWGNDDKDFWKMYDALPLLQVLSLVQCSRLRDESIIGSEVEDYNRSMLSLKYLKHLKLVGFWTITDNAFRKVFSKMKLLTLEVWTDVANEQIVTLVGLEALTKGIFGETVEFIKINRPYNSTHLEVRKLLRKCKCLKRFELREGTNSDVDEDDDQQLFSVHHL